MGKMVKAEGWTLKTKVGDAVKDQAYERAGAEGKSEGGFGTGLD
jgi:hypothetical protein